MIFTQKEKLHCFIFESKGKFFVCTKYKLGEVKVKETECVK